MKNKEKLSKESYQCNHCGYDGKMFFCGRYSKDNAEIDLYDSFDFLICPSCKEPSIVRTYFNGSNSDFDVNPVDGTPVPYVIYVYPPLLNDIPEPNSDMSENVKDLYIEAKNVFPFSYRGSCALLRLALETLCIEFGMDEAELNIMLDKFITKYKLNDELIKALHTMRVGGNKNIHPSKLPINNDPSFTKKMFELLNYIVDELISNPKLIKESFDSLPEDEKQKIEEKIIKTKKNANNN